MTDDRDPIPVRKAAIGGMIPPALKAAVHKLSAQRGIKMRDIIEQALAEWIAKHGEDEE